MSSGPVSDGALSRPVTAGVVSALVGFTSSFVIVLTGLAGVGADAGQAASGLLTVSVTMGLSSALLAFWTRMPITVAWSTPGAALLASTGTVDGGWPAAVGAFLVTGVLFAVTGLVPWLGAGRDRRCSGLPSRAVRHLDVRRTPGLPSDRGA